MTLKSIERLRKRILTLNLEDDKILHLLELVDNVEEEIADTASHNTAQTNTISPYNSHPKQLHNNAQVVQVPRTAIGSQPISITIVAS